jgi:hypothetical protein
MALLDEAGFKEGEHPRGQPNNAGQFAPAGGGGGKSEPKIKGTGRGAKPQPDFRGSMAHETDGDTTQPVKSVDELYERARKAEAPFKNTVEEMAKKFGSTVEYTPEQYAEPGTILKSRKSADRKVASELGGDPKLLRDVLRATISSGTVDSTRQAAAAFIGEQGDNILRVKDRYSSPVAGGYRDVLINYRTPEGLVAEVQFNSKNMIKAKNEDAHKIYEILREMPPADATPALVERLEQQMAEIYEKAYQQDGDGNWKKAQIASDSARDAAPGAVFRRYKLVPPDGTEFEAALIKDESGGISVQSNRDGTWKPEEEIHFADLIAPEQAMSEWEVTAMEPGELSDPIEGRATDRRAVRDTSDIEYYTSEALGPKRELTPEGFLICFDVPAARVGEMIYGPGEVPPELGVGRDGRIRVTRSATEVFNPLSMASINGKPITDDHPPVDVDPKNWKFYTKGVVVSPRRGEGDLRDFMLVDLVIWDHETIQDINQDKREVSCGYNPEYLQLLDRDSGDPILGRGEQVKIRYNHLALVKAGRCGPYCSIGDRKTVDQMIQFWSPARERRLGRLLRRISK